MDWVETTYEGFLEAAESIMEWVMMVVGGIALVCILPLIWGYMWIYRHYIEEQEDY